MYVLKYYYHAYKGTLLCEQKVLGFPRASMRMGSGKFLNQSHSRNLEQICAQQ